MPSRALPSFSSQRTQRGVVLFVALIAMVLLSLAGVALLRSIDSSTSVAGNIAFRQSTAGPVNFAIEQAIQDLFVTKFSQTADNATYKYFATIQAGEKPNGVPAALSGAYPPSGYAFATDTDPTTGAEVRAVVERVCNANTPIPPTDGNLIPFCDLLPPKVSPGGTDNETGRIPLPPIPHFRITVRVDLPRTNAVSYAQAFVR